MSKIYGIGIDLGGTSIKYALGSTDGEILMSRQRPSYVSEDKTKIIDQIVRSIQELKEFAVLNNIRPTVIGVGTPGCVDIRTGYLSGSTPNFRSWRNINIATEVTKTVGIPTFVDNDANLMALGEAKYGAGIGHDNIICLTIGTGIGGGILIEGDLFRGSRYAGAELGHVSIKLNGLKCRCGGQGCLERYASATAMIDHYVKNTSKKNRSVIKDNINVKQIFKFLKEGDQTARETIELSTYYLGRGIANYLNIFNPTIVIIGGGVAEAGVDYIGRVKRVAFDYAMECSKQKVKIVKARLGNKAGYMGAIYFAAEQYLKNIK
jgi:glucokinase